MGILQVNVSGKYHVDERCIGCAICSEIAPHNFRSDHERAYAYVYKQPENDLEDSLCAEVMDICPVNAIGDTAIGDTAIGDTAIGDTAIGDNGTGSDFGTE